MIYFPETIKQWVQCYWRYLHTFFLLAMHANSLCACSRSEAMKGSFSLRLLILSRLLASPVWAQLTLTDPTWGAWSLHFQNGDPFHRVRAHSLTGVQKTAILNIGWIWYWLNLFWISQSGIQYESPVPYRNDKLYIRYRRCKVQYWRPLLLNYVKSTVTY